LIAPELLRLLLEFYRETIDLVQARHANARSVVDYDANNAYQQVLGRQDVHLRWISDAIADLGGTTPELPLDQAIPGTPARADVTSIIEADARSQKAFLDRWLPCVPAVTNARHRKLLELILGEMAEHFRVFQQALDGRTDLLGRHAQGKALRGEVLPARPRN
jgi:hypothetical protein